MISRKFIVLIFFAALTLAPVGVLHAQGTPADSGKCPWKLPFYIYFSASYEEGTVSGLYNLGTRQYDQLIGDTVTMGSTEIAIFVDSNSYYSFSHDTLRYGIETGVPYPGLEQGHGGRHLSIIFVPGHDSISSLTYSNDTEYSGLRWGLSNEYSLSLSGLNYDSTSVFCRDSSLSHAIFTGSFFTSFDYPYGNQTDHNQTVTTVYGLTSVILGGIIRPITLSASAAVSIPTLNSNVSPQSYPNPFTQSTTIQFTQKTSSYADISIVNLLGAEVAHLYSGELTAGEHSYVWSNPTALPAGTYECLIRMNGRVQTVPMVLMR